MADWQPSAPSLGEQAFNDQIDLREKIKNLERRIEKIEAQLVAERSIKMRALPKGCACKYIDDNTLLLNRECKVHSGNLP